MNSLSSFSKEFLAVLMLSRWGNLLFLLILQLVSLYYIYFFQTAAAGHILALVPHLVLSTLLIAAGGYLINDYFDLAIDSINKPNRVQIIKKYGKRVLIKWHIIFTSLGLILAAYACVSLAKIHIIALQLISVALLFFYSFVFKKKILIGNIIISILSVMSLMVMPVYSFKSLHPVYLKYAMVPGLHQTLIAVSIFSMMLTLIREVVKDTEDIAGDIQHGCRTLPIVIGTARTNTFVMMLAAVTMILYYIYFGALLHGNFLSLVAFILFEVAMLGLISLTSQARQKSEYAKISNYLKLLMAYGLLTSLILIHYV